MMSRAVSVITVLVVLMVAGAVMADEEASLEAMNRVRGNSGSCIPRRDAVVVLAMNPFAG